MDSLSASSTRTSPGQFLVALVCSLIPVLITIILITSYLMGLQGTVKLGGVDLTTVVSKPQPPSTPSDGADKPQLASTPVTIAAIPAPITNEPVTPALPDQKPVVPATASIDTGKGLVIYNTTCVACHAVGVAGAPKTGDKASWSPRLAAGKAVLYESALKGRGAMPAKGGNESLSDVDVMAAVDYMVSQIK